MTESESIKLRSFNDTLFFTAISHDSYCSYKLPGHGLMWVRSGRMEIESKDCIITAKAGQYIFWQRDCSSSMRKLSEGGEPFSSIAITLTKPLLKEYFRRNVSVGKVRGGVGPLGRTAMLLPDSVEMESLFFSLLPYADRNIEPSQDIADAKVMEAIGLLLKIDDRFHPTLFDFHETWKIDLYDFMKTHFTEDLTINEFAHYSGRSLATFKRDFAKISDESPQKWLIHERLKLAARLIIDEDAKPSDVYLRVGFKNKPHFFKSFKDWFGCTPSEYKNKGFI